MVEEAVVAEDVVGDEDASIFITTAKAVVEITFVKPEVAIELIETTFVKSEVAIELIETTFVKSEVAIELIETTAAACNLC